MLEVLASALTQEKGNNKENSGKEEKNLLVTNNTNMYKENPK